MYQYISLTVLKIDGLEKTGVIYRDIEGRVYVTDFTRWQQRFREVTVNVGESWHPLGLFLSIQNMRRIFAIDWSAEIVDRAKWLYYASHNRMPWEDLTAERRDYWCMRAAVIKVNTPQGVTGDLNNGK